MHKHREHLHGHHHADMISVEDARERILGFFSQLGTEECAISDALGQVLTEDIVGKFDVPPWDNSAMDGYALQAPDIADAHPDAPVTLDVIGSIAAGDVPSQSVKQGAAIRIMTGAPLPDGADAVVPFEDTDEGERGMGGQTPDEISVRIPVPPGGNVRPAGGDIAAGTTVIEAGTVLRASEIGVLASLGFGTVKVIRRPVAAILATGNELIEPSEPYQPGKIYNSNSYGVAAAVHSAGGIPKRLSIARDTVESISAALQEGMAKADVVISTAGVSKGDYDLVKDVLAQHGRIELWSVRMRPAKPLAFGMLSGDDGRQVPLLGLPGNPVSSLVAFEQLGRPALYKMMGRGDFERPTVQAVLEEPIHNYDARRVYARAIVTKQNGTYYARLTGEQGSNVLTSMSRANGLAICPEDDPIKEAGEVVTVQMTDWPESVF
ncbi:MAG: molybdopterin molybdotransferase MoeA [Dehalococcoidia bacterium]|nr:molybdopterin molybdotransferase MoeA [Dehalococcoidia bacterium]